jgi:Kef-type K+ transport system membrane component KefB
MIEEIGIVFVFAALLGFAAKLLRQPMIPAYVLAGLMVGPLVLGFVKHTAEVSELSEIAVVIMLFVIGIEMDISRLRKLGLIAIGGGFLQVAACFGLGFGAARLFGMSGIASSYLGFAAAFSSTMVTVKILGDKGDIDSLYGRISVGILIMQDILAIFALSLLTVDTFSFSAIANTFTAAAGLILIVVLVCGKWVLPRLMQFVARDRETLFVVVMGILFIAGFYAKQQHLSLSIGSFLAGLAMARLAYQYEIIGDMKALKSFFTIMFFAALGLGLSPNASAITAGQGLDVLYISIAQYGWFIIVFSISTTSFFIVCKPRLVKMRDIVASLPSLPQSTSWSKNDVKTASIIALLCPICQYKRINLKT